MCALRLAMARQDPAILVPVLARTLAGDNKIRREAEAELREVCGRRVVGRRVVVAGLSVSRATSRSSTLQWRSAVSQLRSDVRAVWWSSAVVCCSPMWRSGSRPRC
jgi:hypothetical protein